MKTLKKLLITAVVSLAFATACTSKPEIAYQPKTEQTVESVSTKQENSLENKIQEDYINIPQIQTFQPPKEEDLIGKFQWPLDNPVITQGFGEHKNQIYGSEGHLGLDMTESFGAPVKAAANGVVVAKGSDECSNFEDLECNYRAGNWIMLYHPDLKVHTVYNHLQGKSYKEIGEKIWQGEIIGYEGGSGYQIEITGDGRLTPVTGNTNAHHLDFMVGVFHAYKTKEGKTHLQYKKIYDPLTLLPKLTSE